MTGALCNKPGSVSDNPFHLGLALGIGQQSHERALWVAGLTATAVLFQKTGKHNFTVLSSLAVSNDGQINTLCLRHIRHSIDDSNLYDGTLNTTAPFGAMLVSTAI